MSGVGAAVVAAGLAVVLAVGCGGEPAAQGKILLIGLDGAEWDLLGPMIEAGELPNLGRLKQEGVYGEFRSLEPLAKSPAIWTTMATGKTPDEHGIGTFVDEKGGQPLTQNMRRVRAIWNILSGLDRTVGVVGWLMSWPAEEVNGFIVSDYLQYGPGKSQRFERRTYPPGLAQELDGMVVPWEEVPWSLVQRFLDAPLDTVNLPGSLNARLRPIKMYAAADLSFARIGLKLYREQNPDFFSVYLRGMDTMGHLYWNYMIPDQVPEGFINADVQPYVTGAVRAYYRFIDELIGPYLDAADDETTVIVVSDHGFKGGEGRGVEAHKVEGVILMAGRGVGRGEITGAGVYDLTPTMLALMGLPPAKDMRGKVLWAALDGSVPRDRFQNLIATYETGERRDGDAPLESPVDEEIKERLRSLGYID